jgi:pimeloyl-ACP methyl ester carboxylesterase
VDPEPLLPVLVSLIRKRETAASVTQAKESSSMRMHLPSSALRTLLFAATVAFLPVLSGCDDDDFPEVAEVCRGLCADGCGCLNVAAEKLSEPSRARPADTPGSPGVVVEPGSKLATQFGTTRVDLNNAVYTRYFVAGTMRPDAVLILIPGFEGGATDFTVMAQQLLPRLLEEEDLLVELWAFDRRGDQLEDRAALVLAAERNDPQLALDFLFGAELGLPLSPELDRRAIFYNSSSDIPFLANWTPLVFSQDIDAVVERARRVARNGNVFLGGHSAGTGFTARYAATDFNLDGSGSAEPGYEKLRGLVLLEGGGGSTQGDPVTDDALDRIEARFDGGLFHAVRDGAPRCTDGTPCTVATEAADCAHLDNPRCTTSTLAYAEIPGLLNAKVLAAIEPAAIQGQTDPDGGQVILQVDQGGIPGNDVVSKVPALAGLSFLPQGTVKGAVGGFVDDDEFVASLAAFVAMSVGAKGPVVDGLTTWIDIDEELPAGALRDNGPAPTDLPGRPWGIEREVTDFDKLLDLFIGDTNFLDWYYASSGLGVTQGLPGLDSAALSLYPPAGRGRRDIENLTQAANIDLPVIAFGGSNGLTPVAGSFVAFAQSIAPCAAPSCDGSTPRVVDPLQPSRAFPTLGGVAGGFEAYISEGYAHVDIVTAEDGDHNQVIGPLAAFLARNAVR